MKKFLICAALAMSCGAARAQFFGVSGGLAVGAASVGIETAIAKQWSLEVAGYWSPVSAWWLQPAIRYWRYEHFIGHFFAVHPTYGEYKIRRHKYRYKGHFTGIGASYGYTWLLAKRLNLTAEGGVGIYFLRDRKRLRNPPDWEPEPILHTRRTVFAPSKLEVSVSYLF